MWLISISLIIIAKIIKLITILIISKVMKMDVTVIINDGCHNKHKQNYITIIETITVNNGAFCQCL